jgi:hypothetical protein
MDPKQCLALSEHNGATPSRLPEPALLTVRPGALDRCRTVAERAFTPPVKPGKEAIAWRRGDLRQRASELASKSR